MSAKTLGASGVLYTDRRDFYISPNVTKELWTDVTPFTTIVSNRGIETDLKDPVFKMFEHRSAFVKQGFVLDDGTPPEIPDDSTGIACAVDGIFGLASTVDNSYVGLEVECWSSDLSTLRGQGLILAASSPNLTICSLGAAFQTVDDDIFYVIGNGQGEGTESPEAWADELQRVWNSTQIFKTPIEITGTLHQAALRGYSSELSRLRMEKNKEHKFQKEKAFLFGKNPVGINADQSGETFDDGYRTDANSNKVRTTYGIATALEDYGTTDVTDDDQNVFTIVEASYKYSNYVDDTEKVFQYIPEAGYKYALCGAGAMSYWSKLDGTSGFAGKSAWRVNLSDMKRDTLGFNYRVLETPHGILKLVPAPALRGPRNKYMLVLSDENLMLKQYRPPMFQANIKTDNAYDGIKDQYFSDEGVGITLLESHKLFKIQ